MKLEDIEYKEDGSLRWKRTSGRAKKGNIVGNQCAHGYIECQVDGIRRKAHQIVWFLHKGYWPIMIDHKNGDRTDNRIENLRECTMAENARNRHSPSKRQQYLPRNIYKAPKNRFRVMVRYENKTKHIGIFDTLEEAVSSAEQARKEHYGDFAGRG